MIVCITGNIGSGKSEAANILEKHGFLHINADTVGHELYKKEKIKGQIVKYFGSMILTNGEVDRKKLKKIVFYSPLQLRALNKITHPKIEKEIKDIIKKNKEKNIIIEAALAIEAGWKFYDKLLLITVDKDKQVKRLLKKGKYNKDEINNIIDSQIAQEKKLKYADYIIDNSGTKKELEKNIKKLIEELK